MPLRRQLYVHGGNVTTQQQLCFKVRNSLQQPCITENGMRMPVTNQCHACWPTACPNTLVRYHLETQAYTKLAWHGLRPVKQPSMNSAAAAQQFQKHTMANQPHHAGVLKQTARREGTTSCITTTHTLQAWQAPTAAPWNRNHSLVSVVVLKRSASVGACSNLCIRVLHDC